MKRIKICLFAMLFLLIPSLILASEVTGQLQTGLGADVGLEGCIKPGTITLSASTGSSSGAVNLSWSAPFPVPTTIEIKYSSSAITAGNYSSATTATSSLSGTANSYTVSGLTAGNTYYFAAKGYAGATCVSDISNSPSAQSYQPVISGGGGYVAPTTTTTTTVPPTTTTTTTKPVSISPCQWCGLACIKVESWMYCPTLTPPSGYICKEVNGVCMQVKGVPTTTTTVPPAGDTVSTLQARIVELQSMINNLLRQLGIAVTTTTTVPGVTTTTTIPPVTVTGIPAGFTFQKDLWRSKISEDVRYLQRFLNSHPGTKIADSGLGSSGNETRYFGLLTKAAVIKFQDMYASEVLAQWGLTKGNGYVGSSTRKKLNELLAE